MLKLTTDKQTDRQTDGQTNRQDKNNMLPIIRSGGIKISSRSQQDGKESWAGHRFCLCLYYNLDINLGQGHDTPLGTGQQLC